MSTLVIIAGGISVAVLGVGLVLWLSMKMTERKETVRTGEWQSLTSDGAGGYEAPGDPCGADGGACH